MKISKLKNIKRLYFGYEELAGVLGVSPGSARVSASRYVKSGYLLRLKRNIYILKDRWDSAEKEEKLTLANLIQVPSYISLMTALDYYEITTEMQRNFIESVCIKRTKEAKIGNAVFNYTKVNKTLYFGFVKKDGFFIATPEKAFLDALYLTSLKRYRFDLSSISYEKLNINLIKKMIGRFPHKTGKILEGYGYLKKTRNI